MGKIVTVTAAADKPVTLESAKIQCRILDDDSHDAQIFDLITAATEEWETETRQVLVTRTLRYDLDGFCSRDIVLPVYPVTAITSIKYDDESDVEQTLSASEYWTSLAGMEPVVRAVDYWPGTYPDKPGRARITFTAGYATYEIPESAKQAILVRVYDLWNTPGATDTGLMPSLVNKHRRYGL